MVSDSPAAGVMVLDTYQLRSLPVACLRSVARVSRVKLAFPGADVVPCLQT